MQVNTDRHYRHKKTGGVYVVIGTARLQIGPETLAGDDTPESVRPLLQQVCDHLEEHVQMVLYTPVSAETGTTMCWARPLTEFTDGRFEELPS